MVRKLTAEKRFLAKVNKIDSCWLWTASKNLGGYGYFSFKGKSNLAHRVSYELFVGQLHEYSLVCHSCDNPSCVNPDHLWLGTNADNIRDMDKKGRRVAPRGEAVSTSKLTETQVLSIREKYATGEYTQSELGKEFKVRGETISKIVKGTRWAHLLASG